MFHLGISICQLFVRQKLEQCLVESALQLSTERWNWDVLWISTGKYLLVP